MNRQRLRRYTVQVELECGRIITVECRAAGTLGALRYVCWEWDVAYPLTLWCGRRQVLSNPRWLRSWSRMMEDCLTADALRDA